MSDILQKIRDQQYTDKSGAEALLLSFLKETLPFSVQEVELTPLAVSLNSFNGFLTLEDGTRRFFKTHTETDTIIDEYYNAELLANAGYPVIQPIYKSTEPGKQLLIYEVINDRSVFDVAWDLEQTPDDTLLGELTQAQNDADAALLRFYQATSEAQSDKEAQNAPIHQLFYHRLVGGRLERFYGDGTTINLPSGKYDMATVRNAKWQINGQMYHQTLNDIINRAIALLKPSQSKVTIVGHGDAHNGNIFFQQNATPPELLYFDPAFAGRHHPLLDLTKPLFHNVFAMWMYFPSVKHDTTAISLEFDGDTWRLTYDYELPQIRHMFLRSKIDYTLLPILQAMQSQGQLRDDWREYLKAALFCCPFLTMDLTDGERFPPEISLLGLAMSVEMGAESSGKRSLIDRTLDDVATALSAE